MAKIHVLIHFQIPGQILGLISGSFISNIDVRISDNCINATYVAGLDLCNFNNVAKFLEQITELEY